MANNKQILKIIANSKPMFLAFLCCSTGSLSDKMEIKIMLSTPRTTSKKANVKRLIQICGSAKLGIENANKSIVIFKLIVAKIKIEFQKQSFLYKFLFCFCTILRKNPATGRGFEMLFSLTAF
jgi:hypothetical protein